jgi:serine O-acetyltransferase
MIKNYKDYKDFVRYEKSKEGFIKKYIFIEPTAKFLKLLRKTEYYYNSNSVTCKVLFIYYYYLYKKISLKTGITIPKNVCKKGLFLPHFGSIVVNANCKIGKNCMIQNNVNIGTNGGSSIAPRIGDNVYIGPGAVIFGDITIADNCYIGANAVVNKSFLKPYSVIVGIPAQVVKKETMVWWQKNKLSLEF